MRSKLEFQEEISRLQTQYAHMELLAATQELSVDEMEDHRELLKRVQAQIKHLDWGLKKCTVPAPDQNSPDENELQNINALYQLEYDPKYNIVTLTWRSEVNSAQYRAINEQMLSYVSGHKAVKIIDAIHFGLYINPADRQWSVHYLVPKLYGAGVRLIALVVPQNPFTLKTVGDVVNEINPDDIEIKYFSTIVRARMWLSGF